MIYAGRTAFQIWEPVDFLDPELRGLPASIGIRKDKPFAPAARMKAILTDAVAVTCAMNWD